ncbi:S49 family peptidase [Pararhodospirillum oryzae]|uniref:Protease n=1 Tax=Pararhodospirillum oryzae TaxID=478448 RepID=A0A512H881_9PROT|nr:S49 family peptidase [Pararhodospirillum oryzae]GEO81610.1 protease [Pararhodospirillum oryzae]
MRFFGKALVALLATLGLLTCLAAGMGALALSRLADSREPLPDQLVLTLAVDGPMSEAAGDQTARALMAGLTGQGEGLGLFETVRALRAAARDPKVDGLLVHLGGTPLGMAQAQELRDAIHAFRATGKPALVFSETLGEFGGGTIPYYLAAAFDQVWVQPSGMIAATGFSLRQPFARGLLDRFGIVPEFETRKDFKNAASALTDHALTPPARVALDAVVQGWMGQVVAGVAADRGLEPARVQALIDQAPLLAEAAREAGLVDRLGYVDEVEEAMTQASGTPTRVSLGEYAADLAHRPPVPGARKVAYLAASGPVVIGDGHKGPFDEEEIDGRALAAAIDKVVENPGVAGIVLRLDSPGGSYVGSDVVWRAIARARGRGMPIIASMGDVAASGGYFIAMGANRIVAQPGTLTGSIGVLAGKVSFGKASADLGVTWDGVSAGRNAAFLSPVDAFDAPGRERLNAMLDAIYADFTGKAARARNLSPAAMEAAAQGRVWTGADAQARGLVDSLGGVEQALALVRVEAGLSSDTPLEITPVTPGTPGAWFLRLLARVDGVRAVAALVREGAALEARLGPWLDAVGVTEPGVLRMPPLER